MNLDILVEEIEHKERILNEKELSMEDLMDSFEDKTEEEKMDIIRRLDKETLQKLREGGII